MNIHNERAMILIQQGRWDLAQDELVQALAQDPDSAQGHALLSHCFLQRENPDVNALQRATEEAQEAIRCDAGYPFGYAALARAMLKRNRFPEAQTAVSEAIRIAPDSPDYYVLAGGIEFAQSRWAQALKYSELALQLDSQNADANNLRVMALVKLGRRVEAGASMDEVLRRNPDDSNSHANKGWTLLEQGKPAEAMNHFKEALRLEPNNRWARNGIIEAIRAQNFIYGLLLKYFLWMARFSGQAQLAFMIGSVFLRGAVAQFGATHPQYALYCDIFIYGFLAFVLLTWVSVPLFNLVLRTHPLGKYALTRDEKMLSNLIGACFFGAAALAIWALYAGNLAGRETAVQLAFLVIPIVATFSAPAGRHRLVMSLVTFAFLLVGIMIAYIRFTQMNPAGTMITPSYDALYDRLIEVFFYGIVITSYATGYLSAIPRRK